MMLLKKKAISKDLKIANLDLLGCELCDLDSGYAVIFNKSDLPKIKRLIKNLEQKK